MAYQVLARKYRPQRFADVAGQDHVTVTLMNALRQNRIAHGYIFSGHRGIGKTTIARILACALNCRNAIGSELRPTPEPCLVCESCTEIRSGSSVDVIEIDAATNRGIDEIRELRDAARYRPSRDRFKIYILDEAHQITDAAFNALLKTLEEPPDHIVFMMATTQPEDIPQTVRSRCQHFNFHAVKLPEILRELRGIAEHERVQADDIALGLLAEAGDGSMRDALSIMDQAIASAPVEDGRPHLDAAQIRELMGTVPYAVFERVLAAVDGNRAAEVMTVANDLMDAGNSPAQLARQAVRYLRSCLMAKVAGLTPESTGTTELLQISPEEQRRAAGTASLFTEEELTRFLQVMLRTFDELGYRQEQRFHLELGLLKLVHLRRLLPVEEILGTLGGRSVPRPAGSLSAPREQSRAAVPAAVTTPGRSQASPAEAAKPAFTPFERDQRRRFEGVEQTSQGSDQAVEASVSRVPARLPAQEMIPSAPALAAGAVVTQSRAGQAGGQAARAAAPETVAEHAVQVAATPVAASASVETPGLQSTTAEVSRTAEEAASTAEAISSPAAAEANGAAEVETAADIETAAEEATVSESPAGLPEIVRDSVEAARESVEAVSVAAASPETASQGQTFSEAAGEEAKASEAAVPKAMFPEASLPEASVPEAAVLEAAATGQSEEATAFQRALTEALSAAGQGSAADALEDAQWTVSDGEVRAAVPLSKMMLAVVVNAEAEKIARGALRGLPGAEGLKLVFVPGGSAVAAAGARKPKKAKGGSAEAKAAGHPMVLEAQWLFSAEIQTVIDLSE